jgi:thioesterase domain-containing protein
MWEELLGAGPVGGKDDFFDLGGDSMAAVELTDRLERRYGVALPLDALLPALTVERLARLLAETTERAASPLVPIHPANPEGSLSPFFCVHPSGGSVLCYLDLARRLGSDRPFYGLQGPDPRGDREPLARIEDMAAEYLAAVLALRASRPEGRLLLGGYSFGGYVAFEMARQLVARGEEPPKVVLLDTRAPSSARSARSARASGQPEGGLVADLAAVLEAHDLDTEMPDLAEEKRLWDDFTALALRHLPKVWDERGEAPPVVDEAAPPSGLPRRRRQSRLGAIQRFFRAYRFLPAGEEMDYRDIRRYMRFLRAYFRASRAYAPGPYPHPVTLLLTTERLTPAETDPEVHAAGWAALVGELEVRRVPGHHLTLLAPPAVDALAAELRACLEQADGPGGGPA